MTSDDCVLCAGVSPSAQMPVATRRGVVAYVDDELIALVEPGLPGVVIAPRSHTRKLPTPPGLSGSLMAALRKAVIEVELSYGTSGAMVEPTTHLPGADGHVCYQVVPTLRDDVSLHPSMDSGAEARRLSDALCEHAVPRRMRSAVTSRRSMSSIGRPFGLVQPDLD